MSVYRYDDYNNNNNVSRKEFWSVDGGGGMLRRHCYTRIRTSARRITRKILIVLYNIIAIFSAYNIIHWTLHGTQDDSPIRAFVSRTGQIVPYREKKSSTTARSFPGRDTVNNRGVDNNILYWSIIAHNVYIGIGFFDGRIRSDRRCFHFCMASYIMYKYYKYCYYTVVVNIKKPHYFQYASDGCYHVIAYKAVVIFVFATTAMRTASFTIG